MCRLFGFRSIVQSQVHSSLVGAENSFMTLSNKHPDGWGVAYYIDGSPHVIKSESAAVNDQLFKRVSGLVASQTILAHLRKATLGLVEVANTHPFQYGKWVFAHNGNIKDFEVYRDNLLQLIPPHMKRFILGGTDSEILFYIILAELESRIPLRQRGIPAKTLVASITAALKTITTVVGSCEAQVGDPSLTYLTFIITNGDTIAAHQGGQPLWYSTFKSRCPDRDSCGSFSPECEAPSASGKVNHLLFSSEPIEGENIWHQMDWGQILATDNDMVLTAGSTGSGLAEG